ncbi:MAG: hypothetical protein MUF54_14790, partial [Polyangiaceae bacterium]|nr:hypothetical protein [Polyangiaceae bacterium]
QAGQRTAGAMSALLCGVGAAPFGLAPLRDLPGLKLRCWSDLAAGAGADLRFFYADNIEFDRYGGSLVDHGFNYLHVPKSGGRPRGVWGLSDRGIFEDILRDLEPRSSHVGSPPSLRVRGVLTLSTHSPYDAPDDMPAEARDRAYSLAAKSTADGTKQSHWVTISYLDQALSEFVPTLIQAEIRAGYTPVLLLVGDHTSGATVGKGHLPAARIPAFWVFPASVDRRLLQPVQRELDVRSWSQNDLARMILALLDHSGTLRVLPSDARWHSMGGQSLSAGFAVLPPWQPARLWTIDTHARSRLLAPGGQVLAEDIAESPATRQHLDASAKPMDMALPGLSWLLQHPERVGLCGAAAPAASSGP